MIVTLDGPAGAGKSTVGKSLAKKRGTILRRYLLDLEEEIGGSEP